MLVKRAQRQEVKSLVLLKVAAAKVMLRRGVAPAVITAVLQSGGEKRADLTDFLGRMSTGFTRKEPGILPSSETLNPNKKIKMQPLPNIRSKARPTAPVLQTTKESSQLVKRAQRQEVQSLVMLKVAAAQVMLRRGVNPTVINAMLQVGREKQALPVDPVPGNGTVPAKVSEPFDWASLLNSGMLSHAGIGAALGGGIGGLHGLLDDDDDEDDEDDEMGGRRKRRSSGMSPVLSRALGGAAIGGLGGAAASAAGVPAMLGFPPKA